MATSPVASIAIYEELDKIGGALDGSGSPENGYVLRGGRMFESQYRCTFELFSSIPTLDGSKYVTQEIFAWNETMKTSSKSPPHPGRRQTAPRLDQRRHILTIEHLALEPEACSAQRASPINSTPRFFETDFWFMWCSTFAFQPWHSAVEFERYLVRFAHMISGYNKLESVTQTVPPGDAGDTAARNAHARASSRSEHARHHSDGARRRENRERLAYERDGRAGEIAVGASDYVFTLGSMTEASSLGYDGRAPALKARQTAAPGRFGRSSQ